MTHRERIPAPGLDEAPAPPRRLPQANAVLALQRAAGNQAVVRMLARSPTPPAAVAPTPAAKVRVQDGAAPSTKLEGERWGLTWPEAIEVTIDARRDGAAWKPVVTELVGRFSVQTRLLPGVQPVLGPGHDTTEATYKQQIADLDSLAPPKVPVSWYMIEAVEAHEAVHAQHMEPGFKASAPRTIAVLEAVELPDDGATDAAQAAARLQAEPAFAKALADRLLMWQADTFNESLNDHDPGGPTKAAERVVVDQMIAKIRAEAVRQGWPL